MSLQVQSRRTRIFHPGESLGDFLKEHLRPEDLPEETILVVTSKIVSLAEGRRLAKDRADKLELIRQEADFYLGEIAHGTRLAIKHHLLMPAAGVDESNSEKGDYILLPKDPFASAQKIRADLLEYTGRSRLGVILSDSQSRPLRLGVSGVALGYAGFAAIRDRVGQKDLFGRPLRITKMNLLDALAAAAVMMMGEADEQCPLAVIRGAPVQYLDQTDPREIMVSPTEDLYYPLYRQRLEES